MGVAPKLSQSVHDRHSGHHDYGVNPCSEVLPQLSPFRPNPNPYNFVVTTTFSVGKMLIAVVNYPDATSFEGNKILVYEGVNNNRVRLSPVLDPHFSEEGLSPVARFKPDERGLRMAIRFCDDWNKYDGRKS